jgi:hypothetical protein
MSVMEGKEDIFAELREKFWPTFKVITRLLALSIFIVRT